MPLRWKKVFLCCGECGFKDNEAEQDKKFKISVPSDALDGNGSKVEVSVQTDASNGVGNCVDVSVQTDHSTGIRSDVDVSVQTDDSSAFGNKTEKRDRDNTSLVKGQLSNALADDEKTENNCDYPFLEEEFWQQSETFEVKVIHKDICDNPYSGAFWQPSKYYAVQETADDDKYKNPCFEEFWYPSKPYEIENKNSEKCNNPFSEEFWYPTNPFANGSGDYDTNPQLFYTNNADQNNYNSGCTYLKNTDTFNNDVAQPDQFYANYVNYNNFDDGFTYMRKFGSVWMYETKPPHFIYNEKDYAMSLGDLLTVEELDPIWTKKITCCDFLESTPLEHRVEDMDKFLKCNAKSVVRKRQSSVKSVGGKGFEWRKELRKSIMTKSGLDPVWSATNPFGSFYWCEERSRSVRSY